MNENEQSKSKYQNDTDKNENLDNEMKDFDNISEHDIYQDSNCADSDGDQINS